MHILIIGYSSIVRRRVIPALSRLDQIGVIEVATISNSVEANADKRIDGEVYLNYDEALFKSKADLVYVSTVNNAHALSVRNALEAGFHVIVDKPAFLNLQDAIDLVALSKSKNLLLAEALVYEYHPQIQLIDSLFKENNDKPLRISSMFSFPPLPENNFRYSKDLGGGALWDLGLYALSPGRIFFKSNVTEINGQIDTRNSDVDIEVSFSVLANYGAGMSIVGHYGFDSCYQNWMNLTGKNISVSVERIFTNTGDLINVLRVKTQIGEEEIRVPPADCFECFFEEALKCIEIGRYQGFSDKLTEDANSVDMLRKSVLNG